jgi:hypothetical protein
MSEDKEESFSITPKGVLSLYLTPDDLKLAYTALKRYMKRSGYNGMLLENGELTFIEVQQIEEEGIKNANERS